MKLKLTDEGHPILTEDGKLVYIDDSGQEGRFDWEHAIGKIKTVSDERDGLRKAIEQAEAKLKAFEGLEPDKAREALRVVGSLDTKKLIDAGEVEKAKAEWSKERDQQIHEKETAFAKAMKEREEQLQAKEQQIYKLKVSHRFQQSPFMERLIPALRGQNAERLWGSNFQVDKEGNLVAVDAAGNRIYSKERPGEPADFDEALQIIVMGDPNKDHYLLSDFGAGSGAESGGSQYRGSAVTLSREQARDAQAYRTAKEAAEKRGVPLRIEPPKARAV